MLNNGDDKMQKWNVRITENTPGSPEATRNISANIHADKPGTAMMIAVLEMKINEDQIIKLRIEKVTKGNLNGLQ